jgi:DNA polymerase III subunit epsilon
MLGDWLVKLGLSGSTKGHASGRSRENRWVVIDIETTGLNKTLDQVLSIGAVAIWDGQVRIADSFEAYIRPSAVSASENILVHGISGQQQMAGLDPRAACNMFLDFVADAPLVGFQSSFDRGFLARAAKTWAEAPLPSQWLDVAELARMVYPQSRARALDDWLEQLKIDPVQRHSAIFDAFATAMLFTRLLHALPDQANDFNKLQNLASQARFLPR